jgi:hypothetical protein
MKEDIYDVFFDILGEHRTKMLHIYLLTHPRKFEVELVRLYSHASEEEKTQINKVCTETDLDYSFE